MSISKKIGKTDNLWTDKLWKITVFAVGVQIGTNQFNLDIHTAMINFD